MKWSDSVTFRFVEEYLKHECLYNSKCKNYRNKIARDAALIKICEVININDFGVKEAMTKIKSIRSTYSQELKKINESNKSGAGTDEVYTPTLKWFKLYDGVVKDKNLTPKESQSNLNSMEIQFAAEGESMSSADESLNEDVPVVASSSPNASNTQETESVKKLIYSRKRNIKCLNDLVNKVKAVGQMVHNPSTSNNNNEFDIFAKSVAAQLKAMPLMYALQAQSHIQNYLTTLRVHSITNPLISASSPSPPSLTTYISSPSPSGINNSEITLMNTECIQEQYRGVSPDTLDSVAGVSEINNESTQDQSVTMNSNMDGNNIIESREIYQSGNIFREYNVEPSSSSATSTSDQQGGDILQKAVQSITYV